MKVKLTLTIDKAVIEKAKIYAQNKGISLSDNIENYLKVVTKENDAEISDLTPIVKSMRGSFRMPKNLKYKDELTIGLSQKYL